MDAQKKRKMVLILLIYYWKCMQDRENSIRRFLMNSGLTDSVIGRQKIWKISNFYEDIVPRLTPRYFRRQFRMYKEGLQSLTNYLSNSEILQNAMDKTTIPLEKQVAMTMGYLGSKSTTITQAHLFGISEERFLYTTELVLDALIENIENIIKWPERNEYPKIAHEFNYIGKHFFPNCIGAIDGCHLEIEITDEKENQDSYNNYHNWNSLILQATCTYDLTFIYIQAGWPGRAADAGVFAKSSLKRKLDSLMTVNNRDIVNSYHIVGDSAFPIMKHLLVPYKGVMGGHLDPVRTFFNRCLSCKRQNIERAFGLLIRRFPRLTKLNMKTLRKKIKVIMAACVLHNICIREHDNIDYFLRQAIQDKGHQRNLVQVPYINDARNRTLGKYKRNLICARLYNQGAVITT